MYKIKIKMLMLQPVTNIDKKNYLDIRIPYINKCLPKIKYQSNENKEKSIEKRIEELPVDLQRYIYKEYLLLHLFFFIIKI